MIKTFLHFAMIVLLPMLIVGCGNSSIVDGQNETDTYNEAREAAWNFLEEKRWNETTSKDWHNADVSIVAVNDNYELLNPAYEGEEALSVVFEEAVNSVTGTPTVLVDADTNEVIGYMPTE